MKGSHTSFRRAAACIALLVALRTANAQQVVVDANSLAVREGNSTLLRYHHSDVPFKPYVQELFTPSGANVLLDAPPDHLHHHALMFACAVNNVDFWGEAPGPVDGHFERLPGKQQHLRFDDVAVIGPVGHRWGRYGESLRWVSQPNSEPLLAEQRTITAGRIGDPAVTFLTWESRLSVPQGKDSIVLSGSHYHGLGLRFIRSMDATGEFRNPDNAPGAIFRGEERLTRSTWCAYTAQANGKTVTVAMFDHPDNPRHPATWFTMAKPFAYLSATLRLHEEPLKLVSGKALILRYAVVLWDGRPETTQIDRLYKQWVAMPTVKEN
ncbi:MAG: PmoA family protein [Planctomycetes bacterium]|nr:PmoA family protein [Planctomycetota bacterium]